MDYNFRFFPAIPNLGTFGNNWKKSLLQTLRNRLWFAKTAALGD
jgi:hypothetical protein